ncbi:MAG: DUF115 domain-containing protein [Phycisphaerae bacterium]|nr:DUF115 domain-containing protein [Phycisphaerae bacterium]
MTVNSQQPISPGPNGSSGSATSLGTSVSQNSIVRDDIYVRNMAALFRCDSPLAQQLDELEDDGTVIVEASRTGVPSASVRVPGSDRPLQLHSKFDPMAEAAKLAESVEIGESFCYIVGGFGLGHHLKALLARLKGDVCLIVLEPNLQILKKALETVDLTELFQENRCILLTSTDKNELQNRLEPHSNLLMIGTQFVVHPASERLCSEFHATMRKLIADHLMYYRMCLVTLVANSRITNQNVSNNLPTYLATPPIDILRDRFAGYPAIVVSAGPSLRKNIDQLAKLKGKAVIIAVQTTYKLLLDRGIEPDFVTSLDYHEMSRKFFEGIKDFGQTHLVAEPKVTWHVVDTYKGRVSLLGNDFATMVLGEKLGRRGSLKAGSTVAHLAFYLAAYMGCEPIVLIGQDLGYSGHVYYSPGVAFHEMWRPDLNRFSTMEMKEWERIVRHRNILLKVKDIHGREIYTDEQLFTYLQQFEVDFLEMPGDRVIDATEGGVRKTGTRIMPLAEVAERYCSRAIPAERFAYRDELKWWDNARLSEGRQPLQDRISEIDELIASCKKMLAVLKELTGMVDRPDVFNRRLAEVDALRVRIRQNDLAYRMVSSVTQHAELQRFAADRRLSLIDLDAQAIARRQLERDVRFVEAIIEGAQALKDILAKSIERIDAAMKFGFQHEPQHELGKGAADVSVRCRNNGSDNVSGGGKSDKGGRA